MPGMEQPEDVPAGLQLTRYDVAASARETGVAEEVSGVAGKLRWREHNSDC